MNYETYQQLARRTESQELHLHDDGIVFYQRLAHAQFGMTTEIIELLQADDDGNKNEELGDVFWYVDLAVEIFGCNISALNPLRHGDLSGVDLMLHGLGEFTDQMKRRYYYGKNFELATFKNNCFNGLAMILAGLTDIAIEEGFSIADILEKNIEKLRIRQPGKFSGEAAINRDVEKERRVFDV